MRAHSTPSAEEVGPCGRHDNAFGGEVLPAFLKKRWWACAETYGGCRTHKRWGAPRCSRVVARPGGRTVVGVRDSCRRDGGAA